MRLKDFIGAICMVVITVSGIILSFGLAMNNVLNSDGILNCMEKTNYLEKTNKEAKTVLMHYMTEEKADEILENISVKSEIRKIVSAFDNNTVVSVSNEVKNEMKQAVIDSLEENVSTETKEQYATVVSEAYIKSVFPVMEFDALSGVCETYGTKLEIALAIVAILAIMVYVYLAIGKKTYKWAIIALYNVIILNVILSFILCQLNGIVIGNERTTAVILEMIQSITNNTVIATALVFILAIISNYIAYFRKKRHSH